LYIVDETRAPGLQDVVRRYKEVFIDVFYCLFLDVRVYILVFEVTCKDAKTIHQYGFIIMIKISKLIYSL